MNSDICVFNCFFYFSCTILSPSYEVTDYKLIGNSSLWVKYNWEQYWSHANYIILSPCICLQAKCPSDTLTNYYYRQIALHIGLQRLLFARDRCTPWFLVLQTGFEMAKSDFEVLCKGTALPQIFLRAVDDTHLPLPHLRYIFNRF